MRRTLLLTALLGAFALAPATAWSSGNDVIRDCTDNGRIDDTSHGPQDYSDALANLPTDVDEYTDCRQVISTAQRTPPASSSGGGGGDGGGGGGANSSGAGGPAAKKSARAAKPAAQGPPVVPPGSTLADKPLRQGVPLAVIIVLGVLALAVVAWLLSGWGGRPRVSLGRVVHRVFPRRT